MLSAEYIAGFFDGEGTVRIDRSYAKNRTTRYELQVCAVNTCPEPLWELKKQYGGGVYLRKHLPRHKDTYHWTLGQKAAITFLKDILPYLIIKKSRAELALEFSRVRTNCTPGKKISMMELDLRRTYYEKMKQLNK